MSCDDCIYCVDCKILEGVELLPAGIVCTCKCHKVNENEC